MKKRTDYTLTALEAAAMLEISYTDLSGKKKALSKERRQVGNHMRVFYSVSEVKEYKERRSVKPDRQCIHEGELSDALRAAGL